MLSQIIKQNTRQLTQNVLSAFVFKTLERLIYNKLFECLTENELISHDQSGFKPGHSGISQLVFFTHCVYQSLDDGLDTRVVFLDISKAFEKVLYEGLLFRLKQDDITVFKLTKMDSTSIRLMLKQGSSRNLFLDHYSWIQNQNYLGMALLCSPLFKI